MPGAPDLPDDVFSGALRFLEELTSISSPSGDPEGIARAAGLLARALAARGFETGAVSWEAADGGAELPVLHARGPEARRGIAAAALGHLDTVLPAAAPRREGERLLATGAIDMKGGLATSSARSTCWARGAAPPEDLHLVVVPDEEVGGELSREATAHWGARRGRSGCSNRASRGAASETMVAGRRGMPTGGCRLGNAAHSGLHYWQGHSALIAAARWCAAAEALSRAGGGPTINVGRLIAGDAGFVSDPAGTPACSAPSRA